MAFVEIDCANCNAKVTKEVREFNRAQRLGRRLFCDLRCAALLANKPRRASKIMIPCPTCGDVMETSSKKRARKFCSRSCASSGSVTAYRREAQRKAGLQHMGNLCDVSDTLKKREGWKYDQIRLKLQNEGRVFEFEYRIGRWVFDLALLDAMVLVEFDGPSHAGKQADLDQMKSVDGRSAGFAVIRRKVAAAERIPLRAIVGL